MKAVILKKSAFAEGSEIITLYSRELGKVRGVARSVKSSKSKLAFGLQALFYSEIELAGKGKISVITGVKVLDAFKDVRGESQLIHYALFATEIILKSTADEQPNSELFDLYLSFLQHLNSDKITKHFCLTNFVFLVLALTGYEVDFEKCVVCLKPVETNNQNYFSNRKSGFLCADCNHKVADAKPLANTTLMFLKNILKLSPHNMVSMLENQSDKFLPYSKYFTDVDNSEFAKDKSHQIAESFAVHILERDLKSGRFIM